MAELSTLARPYAKAAFDYANESSTINEWEGFLLVAKHIVSDGSFAQLLKNPAVSAKQKADTLVELYTQHVSADSDKPSVLEKLLGNAGNQSGEVSASLSNFVQQLAEQDRLLLIPHIYTLFLEHKAKVLKQVDAYVTTAYPLTDIQRALIQTRLAASMNATVIVHESVDASLLAGATIKIGDKVVDDSVRGKLKQLKTQLTA